MFLQEFGEMKTFDLLGWINDARLQLDILKAFDDSKSNRFVIHELEHQIDIALEEFGSREKE